MIRIDATKQFPAEAEFTSRAIRLASGLIKFIPKYSVVMWVISWKGVPLFSCGIYQQSLVYPPEFWLMMHIGGETMPRKTLGAARLLVKELVRRYPRVYVRTEVNDLKAKRFAAVCGFVERGIKDDHIYFSFGENE